MSAVKDLAGLVRYARRNPGAIELYMAARAERITLGTISGFTECYETAEPFTGWAGEERSEERVREVVREFCA